MDEKELSDWKATHEDIYSKFKQDLEAQLAQTYHQTILDMGDGKAEPLRSVLGNITLLTSKKHTNSEELFEKAVISGEVSVCCLCCYLLFDDGAERLTYALKEKSKEPGTQEIIDAVWDFRRFYKHNRRQETDIVTDELNRLTLRRWHYDHPQEYNDFTALFQKAYEGDMTFVKNNMFFLMEFLSFGGVRDMMKTIASMVPGNKHYEQGLASNESNPLTGKFAEQLNNALNNEAIRERLLRKNPYLFSLFYWMVFDNGFLHAADLISQTFLKPESPLWQKAIGRRAVEALIGASIDKAHYSKSQWKEVTAKLKKGEAKQVIAAALLEVQGRRGRKSTIVLLEEMLKSDCVSELTEKIQEELAEWKQFDETDSILAYIFAALMKGDMTNDDYNYRTFHAAMREKFPDYNISKGFDWAEALYNAIISEDFSYNTSISEEQIKRGRKHATDIKLRLLSIVNPNTV